MLLFLVDFTIKKIVLNKGYVKTNKKNVEKKESLCTLIWHWMLY
jgi:hypothetical protein